MNIDEKLEGLQKWFTKASEGKAPFWTLYKSNGKDIIQSNFSENDLEESYTWLEELILNQHESGIYKFVVSHRTSKTDSKPTSYDLVLGRKKTSRAGVGAVGASGENFWIQQLMAKQEQVGAIQLENFKETSDLKHQIAMIAATQRNWIDGTKDIIDSLLNNETVKILGTKVMSNFIAPPGQTAIIASLENKDLDESKTQDLDIDINELVNIAQELKKAGFEDPVLMLKKLAKFAKEQPETVNSFVQNL